MLLDHRRRGEKHGRVQDPQVSTGTSDKLTQALLEQVVDRVSQVKADKT